MLVPLPLLFPRAVPPENSSQPPSCNTLPFQSPLEQEKQEWERAAGLYQETELRKG